MIPSSFVYVTCQRGAESTLKREIAEKWPAWRFAYSRPGFATFKLPSQQRLAPNFDLRSIFARSYGFSLGSIESQERTVACGLFWQLVRDMHPQRLHVWQRDEAIAGERDYDPGISELAIALRDELLAVRPDNEYPVSVDALAQPGETVADCVLLEENIWWVGYHQAQMFASLRAGGLISITPPPDVVSRAFLKMEEALAWSELPIQLGQHCVEIGSAPGGASQALLRHGLWVTGIDPAEMHPVVLKDPRFTHIRMRGHEVRRREFRRMQWLTSDVNVAPNYTLDTVEAIVTHPEVNISGLLLTLKLLNWDLADQTPFFLDRIRSWGYDEVRARQLQFNRREICVAAQKH